MSADSSTDFKGIAGNNEQAVSDNTKQIVGDNTESSTRKAARKETNIAKQCARERAEEIQRNLEHPSFVKSLTLSPVSGCYLLNLPYDFCNHHLPNEDATVTLIDENQDTYTVGFLVSSKVLSVGWKLFSLRHNLVEGDALVFELVKTAEFQVYIVRAYSSSGGGWGLGIQNLEAAAKKTVPGVHISPKANGLTLNPKPSSSGMNKRKRKRKSRPWTTDKVADGDAEKSASATTLARARAEELQKNLDPQHPSIVKTLVPSNVNPPPIMGLHLPAQFRRIFLPMTDAMITLVDENSEEYKVTYNGLGFTIGWNIFATSHNLVEGDVLVLQLVKETEFQVYLVRKFCSPEVDEVNGLQKSGAGTMPETPGTEKRRRGRPRKVPLSAPPGEDVSPRAPPSKDVPLSAPGKDGGRPQLGRDGRRSQNNGKANDGGRSQNSGKAKVGSRSQNKAKAKDVLEASEDSIFWGDRVSFDSAVATLKSSSQLSEGIWTKYYKLCRSQNVLLHENLLKRNPKLVDGIISETVIIAEEIKATKPSTFMDKLPLWDQNLEAFEHLGMNVCFLRERLQRLVNFIPKSESESYSKRCEEASIKRIRMEQMKTLETSLSELKKSLQRDVDNLKAPSVNNLEAKFQKEVDNPW